MTVAAAPEGFVQLCRRLQMARLEWALWSVGFWLWRVAGWAVGTLAGLVAIELLVRPPVLVRTVLVWGLWAPGLGVTLGYGLWRAIRGAGLRQTARRVEAQFPQIGHRLEGALDLAGSPQPTPLETAALQQVAEAARAWHFGRAVRARRLRARLLPAFALLLLATGGALLAPARVANALGRLFLPQATEIVVGAVRILSVEPGRDVEQVEGSDLTVRVLVDRPEQVGEAVIAFDDGAGGMPRTGAVSRTRRLSQVDQGTFAYTLRRLRKDHIYRVRVGGSVSETFRIRVVPRPAVETVTGRVTPPAYTGLAPYELEGTSGAVRAPAGSRVVLRVTTNHPVVQGRLRLSAGTEVPLLARAGALAASIDLKTSGTYTVSLLDARGHTNENPVARPLACVPDALPRLRLAEPGRNVKLGLGETLSVRVRAEDDYGLKEVALYFRRNRRGEPQLLKRWSMAEGNAREVDLPLAWRLAAPTFDVGDVVSWYAEGTDFGPGEARTGRSTVLHVTLVNKEKTARREVQTLEAVRRAVAKLLASQRQAHKVTAELPVKAEQTAFTAAVRPVLSRQLRIRTGVLDAAEQVGRVDDPVARRMCTVLLGLGANELATAGEALESLVAAQETEARRSGIVRALPAQAEVIKRLGQILGILPELEEKIEGPPEEETGEDLPTEATDALEKLNAGLEAFQEGQRKVVEATEDLAKKNVDEFTEEDEKKREELRAAEENWANFLRDQHTDLSKVPKQDFSNPSLLGEVLAVLEEVELAEGAMSKKELEIATEAASTGMELAESLTTHLEKWLPDEPDRTAWKMEEPLADYEVPMAELPEKLEDIVGELVEQEEALMEEIDDASSSWADSLDKGAGWDTLDGPISNYSAQGVTGNQLPNTSEIGGRSGEGRQGKSHGEMVGDAAVGKGGRRTPSRLTPDAFEKGEIKDESSEASGGSTGGGKGGAAGAEGLEGPAPPPEKGPLPRLLGKQAQLRNKAERLNMNLKLMGYNTAVLENTLAEFRSVEQELKSGRYRSAARRAHHAVDSLKTAKDTVLGEAQVRADRAARLPREVQREIMDALEAGLPKGYEDLVKAYYERLAEEP